MTILQEAYRELLALTQIFLLEEYSLQERIPTDQTTYEDFKRYALKNKTAQQAPIAHENKITREPVEVIRSPAAVTPLKPPQPIEQVSNPPAIVQEQKTPLPIISKSKEVVAKEEKLTSFFELEPLKASEPLDISDFRSIIKEKFPQQPYLETIPNDSDAKRINSAWELEKMAPEVIVLFFQETPKHRAFLNNLCRAIQSLGIHAALSSAAKCEQELSWDSLLKSKNLRLVIASDYAIYTLPELMKHYKETPKKGRQQLGNVPLFLLSDLSFYLKEPSLKPSLWKALKEILFAKTSLS